MAENSRNRRKPGALHYRIIETEVICDVEIPNGRFADLPALQYVKYETGVVTAWGQRSPKFGLIVTTDYNNRRDTSVSIFKTQADLAYYVRQTLINVVMTYKVLNIYTRVNHWHQDILSWPYVKFHVKQYDC